MKNKIIKIFFLFAIFLMLPSFAWAAPNITSVSGTLSNGNSITISGSNFGTHPSYNAGSYQWMGSTYLPASFKDFEDGSLTTNGFSPDIAGGETILSGGPTNSTEYMSAAYTSDNELVSYSYTQGSNNPGALYASFWFNLPSTTEGGKVWRWYFGPNSSNDTLYLAIAAGSNQFQMSGDFLANAGIGNIWCSAFLFNAWHKVEVLASQPLGVYTVWVDGVQNCDFQTSIGTNPWSYTYTMSPSGHTVDLPNMVINGAPFNYDDIYVDYTPARVEICDGSSWASRGICNTQIPTVWNSNGQSITVSVNKGTFASGAQKYLYVVDSTDTANSNGYSVTFGSGSSDTTPPAAPSGFSVL